jgi:hypothetical protein
MPSPPKTYTYNIVYTDLSYQSFDLTRDEFDRLCQALEEGKPGIRTKTGFIVLKDARTVAEYKAPPEPKPQLGSGLPDLDVETMEWIRQQEALAEELERRGIN